MVAHLVRLKLTVLRNGARRSVWQVVGLVFALLYGLGTVAALLVALAALSLQDAELIGTVLVVGGSLTVLGWWVVPLVAFGSDPTLDPDRFARFPVPRRQLLLGLGIGALVGVPGVMTVLVSLGAAGTWWRTPVAVPVALVGSLLGLATAVAGSRALATTLAPIATARRFREVLMVVILVPLFLLGPLMAGIGQGLGALADRAPEIAGWLGWTPFGAPWALAADAAAGAWGALALRLLVAVGWLALLAAAWDRALAAALVRPRSSGSRKPRSDGLGVFGRVPATPTGAVMARSLVYWLRDSRYVSGVILVPLVPVLLWFVAPGTLLMLALGPITAYFLGWAISADVAMDSSAFWTHVTAPITGQVDRTGRLLAAGALGLPLTVVMAVVSLVITGRWDLAPPVLGVSVAVLLTALGLASVLSARVVYPVPQPGANPFSSPQGGSMAAMLSQAAGSAALVVLLLPTTALAVATLVTGSTLLGWLTSLVGLLSGGVYLVVGVRMGGRLYDRRSPELMERLLAMS